MYSNYNRLKGEPVGIDPIFVRNDDQIIGLTNLLTVAVRLECLIEVQVARGLHFESKEIKGLYPGLPNKGTDHPTAVAMLKAIDRKEITLTRAEFNGNVSSSFALAGLVAGCIALLASVVNSLCRLTK